MPTRTTLHSVSLVGAGKVGSTLAALLQRRGHRIVSVISRNRASARILGRVLNAPVVSTSLKSLSPQTDLLLIATPDELIAEVAAEAGAIIAPWKTSVTVLHPSGVLTSDALAAVRDRGASVFSLHPIQTFPDGLSLEEQLNLMKGIWYGFEGEKQMLGIGRSLVKDLGGKLIEIPKEEKILYHVACVFASNYPTVLLGAVERLSKTLKLPGLSPFGPLVETAVRQAVQRGPGPALTGPLARGSLSVVQQHLDVLRAKDPALASLYESLGSFGLEVAKTSARLTGSQIKALGAMFKGTK